MPADKKLASKVAEPKAAAPKVAVKAAAAPKPAEPKVDKLVEPIFVDHILEAGDKGFVDHVLQPGEPGYADHIPDDQGGNSPNE